MPPGKTFSELSKYIVKVRSTHLSVFKNEKWIRISITSGANNLNKDFTEILHSLEFK